MPDPDPDIYHHCFNRRREGHAIYEGESALELKPGACGYFEEDGEWTLIADTLNPESLKEKDLSKLEGVKLSKPEVETKWTGPMMSSSMRKAKGDLGVKAGDQHVDAAVTIGFESSTGEGAVLVVNGSVVRNLAVPKYKLYDWVEDNLEELAKIRGVRERGLWMVTKTYTANHRALATVSSKEGKVTWSVKAEVARTGQLGPSAEWWGSQKDSFWKEDESKTGVVLFISGYKWEPSKRFWKKGKLEYVKKSRQKTLGPDDELKPIECLYEDEEEQLHLLTFHPEAIGS